MPFIRDIANAQNLPQSPNPPVPAILSIASICQKTGRCTWHRRVFLFCTDKLVSHVLRWFDGELVAFQFRPQMYWRLLMKKMWMGLMMGGLLFAQIGCSEETSVKPPAAAPGALEKSEDAAKGVGEKAGAAVDDMGEKAGAAIEEAGEKAGAAIEEAGEKAGAAIEDAKDAVKDAAP